MPYKHIKDRSEQGVGALYKHEIPNSSIEILNKIKQEYRVSAFSLYSAIFNILLYKYSNQHTYVLGTTFSGRTRKELEDSIGPYIRNLLINVVIEPSHTFVEHLMAINTNFLKVYQHQYISADDLQSELGNLGKEKLLNYNCLIEMQSFDQGLDLLHSYQQELQLEPHPFTYDTSYVDLSVSFVEMPTHGEIVFHYDTSLFEQWQITRLAKQFNELIIKVYSDLNSTIDQLDILIEDDLVDILSFNGKTDDTFFNETFYNLFQENVIKHPKSVAIIEDEKEYLYEDLGNFVDSISAALFDYGVKRKDVIPVIADRSSHLIATFIALQKIGAVYCPIDKKTPAERILEILEDINPTTVVCETIGIVPLKFLEKYFDNSDRLNIFYFNDDFTNENLYRELWNKIAAESTYDLNSYGWTNSYTGAPFLVDEMQQYIQNFKTKLRGKIDKASRVLEIGCGHGLLVSNLHRDVGYYVATDLSDLIIQRNKEFFSSKGIENVAFKRLSAREILITEPAKSFDAVLCSSVVHYFPDLSYFESVISDAIDLLKDEGIIYLDDLMAADKRDEFILSVREYKGTNPTAASKINWDNDLFIDKNYLKNLVHKFPAITQVEITNKLGDYENELLKYRFDAIIYVNKLTSQTGFQKPTSALPLINYQRLQFSSVNKLPANYNLPGNDDLAYIIYTSGSTGRPKGAMVHHGGMLNHLMSKVNELKFNQDTGLAFNSSISFDISIWQMLAPLLTGGRVAILKHETILHPGHFLETIERLGLTDLEVVPSYLRLVLDFVESSISKQALSHLRHILVTGEICRTELTIAWYKHYAHTVLVNAYGPTEASDDITHYFVPQNLESNIELPLGKSIQNMNVYILNDQLKLMPIGAQGEICVSGIGVGAGYFNQKALSDAVFIENPFKDLDGYKRMYRTGDIGRFNSKHIDFFGRKDNQIKIRGNRIELGEIENKLNKLESVKEGVVFASNKNDEVIIEAYVVKNNAFIEISEKELLERLALVLPDYALPQSLFFLESIPTNNNGKVDKNKLQNIENRRPERDLSLSRNLDNTELDIYGIWSKVLGHQDFDIESNFIEVGGNSLKIIKVFNEIEKIYPGKVTVPELFIYLDIKRLSQKINDEIAVQNKVEISGNLISFNKYPLINGKEVFESSSNLEQFNELITQFLTMTVTSAASFYTSLFAYILSSFTEADAITIYVEIEKNLVIPLNLEVHEFSDFNLLVKGVDEKLANNEPIATGSIFLAEDQAKIFPLVSLLSEIDATLEISKIFNIRLVVSDRRINVRSPFIHHKNNSPLAATLTTLMAKIINQIAKDIKI